MSNTRSDLKTLPEAEKLEKKQKSCLRQASIFQMLANERCRKGTNSLGKPYALHGEEIDESNFGLKHQDDVCKEASQKAILELERCLTLKR